MSDVKTVAVVGAGASSLDAVKCCLEESLMPTCFERSGELGGLWYYTAEPLQEGRVCVASTTTSNISKELVAFSDFPMPKENSNCMHHSQMLSYLHSYAANFDLEKYITYNHDVILVEPASVYDSTGRWTVAEKDRKSGKVTTNTCDAVLVCNGLNARPHWPDIPSLKSFKGRVMHSVEHGDTKVYEGKRVVVIGMGNSGADTAVDASRVSSKVYLVTRRGEWITAKANTVGLPYDIDMIRRANGRIFGGELPEPQFDHKIYRVQPGAAYLDGRVVTSSELQTQILCGYVTVKSEAVSVSGNTVLFSDGSREADIDVIVCATGFDYSFPPLEGSIQLVGSKKGAFLLYRWVFPPSLKHPTLSVVGVSPEVTPILPKLEMQNRWAICVFKKKCHLPDSKTMWRDINGRRRDFVNYVTYMDAISGDVGCKPNIAKLLLTYPRLGWCCYFGPLTAYQYRLTGPGKWDGARAAILGAMERILCPLNTRPIPRKIPRSQGRFTFLKVTVPLVALTAFAVHWWQTHY